MLNSTQAYQLSTAFTPTFLADLPPTSSQSMALQMQNQTAQGGIQAELYKKGMKKQKGSSGLGSLLGGAAAVAAAPFTGGASLAFLPAAMSGGGAIESAVNGNITQAGAGLLNGVSQGYGAYNSPIGPGGQNAALKAGNDAYVAENSKGYVPAYTPNPTPARRDGGAPVGAFSNSTLDAGATAPDPNQPAASSEQEGEADPRYGGLGTAAALAGGAALLKGATDRGASYQNQAAAAEHALKGVSDPRERMRIMNWAQAGPEAFQGMQPDERLVAVSSLAKAGIPLTKQQVRGIPANERKMYQKQYGPDLIPMSTLDKLHSFIDSYDESYGPGRIVKPYNGLEMYLP